MLLNSVRYRLCCSSWVVPLNLAWLPALTHKTIAILEWHSTKPKKSHTHSSISGLSVWKRMKWGTQIQPLTFVRKCQQIRLWSVTGRLNKRGAENNYHMSLYGFSLCAFVSKISPDSHMKVTIRYSAVAAQLLELIQFEIVTTANPE